LTYWLRRYASELYGSDQGTVNHKKILWQYDGAFELRRNLLLSGLFEAFTPTRIIRVADLSVGALRSLCGVCLNMFCVIQHDIRASRWDHTGNDLITSYFQYLGELGALRSGPQILIFLNVIYPSVQRRESLSRLRALLPGARDVRMMKLLNALARGSACPCQILNELQPITRDDVMEWFSAYNIFDSEEIRLKALDRIFQSETRHVRSKTMAEIETCLKEVHRDYVAEQGYL
jgi:hypothetical protein